jgi:hypothetical protein
VWTASIWIKGVSAGGQLSLNTGSVAARTGSTITYTTEWQRFEWYVNEGSATTGIQLDNYSDGLSQPSADILVAFAQVNQGLVAQPYIETTTAAVYEGITDNLPRLDYSGGASCPSLLLEPSRTNEIAYSEYFEGSGWVGTDVTLTSNYGTSPEGVQNSTRVVMSNLTSSRYAYIPTLVNGTTYTFSCWYKGTAGEKLYMEGQGVDGSGTLTNKEITLTGDWQREDLQFVGGSTSNLVYIVDSRNGTGDTAQDFEVWGAQCEAGSYVTSIIPTYGTSASRSKDVCNNTSATDVIGQTEGTLFIDFVFNGLSNTNGAVFLLLTANGGASNRVQISLGGSKDIVAFTLDGGVSTGQAQTGTNFLVEGTRYKVGVSYSTDGGLVLYVNGVLIDSETLASVSARDKIYINDFETSGGYVGNNKINQTLLFKSALTNAELAALTTI